MPKKDIYPGAKCRVIGSARGPEGSSVGRLVKAESLNPIPHQVWGDMWDISALDGKPFEIKITSPDGGASSIRESTHATAAADWLELIEDDPEPPKVEETEREHNLVE